MDELLKLLSEIRPDVDFETETDLIDRGILDSFDIANVVSGIANVFNVEIDVEDIVPDKFYSAQTIYQLINR